MYICPCSMSMLGQFTLTILLCNPRTTFEIVNTGINDNREVWWNQGGGFSVLLSVFSSIVRTPNTGHAGLKKKALHSGGTTPSEGVEVLQSVWW